MPGAGGGGGFGGSGFGGLGGGGGSMQQAAFGGGIGGSSSQGSIAVKVKMPDDNEITVMASPSDSGKMLRIKIKELTGQKVTGQQLAAMQANVAAFGKVADAYSKEAKPAEVYAAHVEATKTLTGELMGVAREAWEMQSETSEKLAAIWAVPAPKARAAKAKA